MRCKEPHLRGEVIHFDYFTNSSPFPSQAFRVVFLRSFKLTDQHESVEDRVNALIDTVTYETFSYTNRGLFEKDKLTFTAMVSSSAN